MKELGYAVILFVIGAICFYAGSSLMMRIEYTGWLGMPSYPYQTQGIIVSAIGAVFCLVGFYFLYKWQRKKAVEIIAEGVRKGRE